MFSFHLTGVFVSFEQPLRFGGPCGIAQIRELQRLLVEAIPRDRIEIDLSCVESVDTAFVQLLVAASATATRRNKTFRLTRVPDDVVASFQRAGFAISPETGRILGT